MEINRKEIAEFVAKNDISGFSACQITNTAALEALLKVISYHGGFIPASHFKMFLSVLIATGNKPEVNCLFDQMTLANLNYDAGYPPAIAAAFINANESNIIDRIFSAIPKNIRNATWAIDQFKKDTTDKPWWNMTISNTALTLDMLGVLAAKTQDALEVYRGIINMPCATGQFRGVTIAAEIYRKMASDCALRLAIIVDEQGSHFQQERMALINTIKTLYRIS